MIGGKQVIIWAIQEFLGNSQYFEVTDWKPGTGAVVTYRGPQAARPAEDRRG
jgi:hypothetical protein